MRKAFAWGRFILEAMIIGLIFVGIGLAILSPIWGPLLILWLTGVIS